MSTTVERPTVDESGRLIEQAQRGSQDAFAELVRRHHFSLRLYLARYVGDPHAADDLAQEVFLTAYRCLEHFQAGRSVQAWLLGIARHRALHYLRTEGRRLRREGKQIQTGLASLLARAAEQAQDTEQAEKELAALRRCLRKLPPHGREILEAFYHKNERAEQIGFRIGRSSGAVRMMLLRIRQALNGCIQRRLAEHP